jgi:DNA replication protein DnaC
MRRIERHFAQSRLLPGKALDGFDFNALPMLSRAHFMALASGDTWLAKGASLLLFGPPSSGNSHIAAARGRAPIENGRRVLFMRTTDIVQRLQAERQALQFAAAIGKLDRFDLLILKDITYVRKSPSRDCRVIRANCRTLRLALIYDRGKPVV